MRGISRTYGNIILQKDHRTRKPLVFYRKNEYENIYIVPLARSNYQSNTTTWLLQLQETFHMLTTRLSDRPEI